MELNEEYLEDIKNDYDYLTIRLIREFDDKLVNISSLNGINKNELLKEVLYFYMQFFVNDLASFDIELAKFEKKVFYKYLEIKVADFNLNKSNIIKVINTRIRNIDKSKFLKVKNLLLSDDNFNNFAKKYFVNENCVVSFSLFYNFLIFVFLGDLEFSKVDKFDFDFDFLEDIVFKEYKETLFDNSISTFLFDKNFKEKGEVKLDMSFFNKFLFLKLKNKEDVKMIVKYLEEEDKNKYSNLIKNLKKLV